MIGGLVADIKVTSNFKKLGLGSEECIMGNGCSEWAVEYGFWSVCR